MTVKSCKCVDFALRFKLSMSIIVGFKIVSITLLLLVGDYLDHIIIIVVIVVLLSPGLQTVIAWAIAVLKMCHY